MTDLKYYHTHNSRPYYRFNLTTIENQHNAKYMGAWEFDDYDFPLDVFYIEKPVLIGLFPAQKYVGLYIDRHEIVAAPCDDIFDKLIVGVEADDGEICISRHPGEHYVSNDLSTWVQGGIGYVMTNHPERQVRVYVVDGRFEYEPVGCLEVAQPQERSFFSFLTWR